MTTTQLVLRNAGYIDPALQERIRHTRLLIAGCGLGSMVAEIAVRTGFEQFTLVDGDTVAPHNLNRQIYIHSDIGRPKVDALATRLLAINPAVHVDAHHCWVSADNVTALVASCDLVVDTIDFLDLPAVVGLHDEARRQGTDVISAFACGWGAVSMVFRPDGASLRDVFGLPATGCLDGATYPSVFRDGLARLAPHLPQDFVAVTAAALHGMVEGRPCPAPQLACGTSSAAALMVTQAVRLLADSRQTIAPEIVHLDIGAAACAPGLRIR